MQNINRMMDELYTIVNTSPTENAVTALTRHVGFASNVDVIEALARLLVVESARRRFAEAKLLAREVKESPAVN